MRKPKDSNQKGGMRLIEWVIVCILAFVITTAIILILLIVKNPGIIPLLINK